jgi:hypothetical protein
MTVPRIVLLGNDYSSLSLIHDLLIAEGYRTLRCRPQDVTDAHAVLGHFGEAGLLGGSFPLDVARARRLEPLLREGYKGMSERLAKISASTAKQRLDEVLVCLVRLYESTGNQAEAAKWRKQLEALRAPQKDAGTK